MKTTLLSYALTYNPWHDGRGDWDGPSWWPVFPIGFGLFWLAVLAGAFYLLRRRTRPRDPREGAETVLSERYARGEIDEEDYRDRLNVLRAR